MTTPILATKLHIPPHRPSLVHRPRLIAWLNQGLHRKLTLISAPAGFGKTTLVSEWLDGLDRPVAWLSLDAGDGDPSRFLAYLVAALQTVTPTLGGAVLTAIHAPQPPATEAILTALLNEIATIPGKITLVLDDYHTLDSAPIDHAIAFLLDHLPPQLHLVITTREDPQLPLARLRARDQMTELRAADLRFTPEEAAAFLAQAMGLSLAAEQVAALEARTEGWIAGLQLAALSLRGRTDVAQFVQAFAGDNRYIVDYLVEEVLQRQPAHVRAFLLQTAILDRLSGPLCDAVTGQQEGGARLEALERGNFFVVPLDDQRHWFRYHHLFADVLAAHLRAEQPDQIAVLHRRASAWYEQHGAATDAIRHALAGGDFAHAADLVELAVPALSRLRQEAMLLGWLRSLPSELVRARPVLSVTYAHLLLDSGEIEGVEGRLRDAEWWLETTEGRRAQPGAPAGEMVVVDEAAFRRLPGAIAVARVGQGLAQGHVADTVSYARRALDRLPEDDHLNRGGIAAFLGLAAWASGDLDSAYHSFAEGMAQLQMAGNIADAIGGAITLADMRIAQGRLREAMGIYERALQLAVAHGKPALRGTADIYVGMSELHCERNDLHAATQCLRMSQELGEHTGFSQHRSRWRVAQARIREAQGDLGGALDMLQEAERLYVSAFSPNVRPIAALRARVWVAQGRLGEALSWARERGLSSQDALSYLREFEHITLARVLLTHAQSDRAEHALSEAMGLLGRLLQPAEAGGRVGSVIEILLLQALAHQARGDIPAALAPLSRALVLAEPESYVRMVVDEGPPLAALLQEALARGIMPDYTGKLLAAFPSQDKETRGQGDTQQRVVAQGQVSLSPVLPISVPLVEPLSQRELEVLRLFRTELSGPEIARKLVIALSTLRTHTKGIYSKLNVDNRRAAVKRAVELGLI
jgi:LuxR family transcriptional regulator, maltose regulon positive regulatory protein